MFLEKYCLMSLYTKCILHPREDRDGRRISVMSRHTLADGITPDLRITADVFDEWYHILAPQDTLVGAYYKRGLSWEDFALQYLASLRKNRHAEKVKKFAERAFAIDITLLCIEETSEHCHRGLLAEECQLYVPELYVEHR